MQIPRLQVKRSISRDNIQEINTWECPVQIVWLDYIVALC